ncbi:MAG TPA: hypothetical protein VLU95_06445, partial [Candidatus Acidoferrum sp.]|nr:hypothetical protein [Candidatus Acidoferrum sp.]
VYKWAREYSPPSIPIQFSNYTILAGILCVAVSVYLGTAYVSINAGPFPNNLAGWISTTPKIATFFIKGVEDLLISGLVIVLFGRSVRLYVERDARLLRNVALIVFVAWFRWILEATANVIYSVYSSKNGQSIIDFNNQYFSMFIFTIVVGILIGIASVLLIYIAGRSTKSFFQPQEKTLPSK